MGPFLNVWLCSLEKTNKLAMLVQLYTVNKKSQVIVICCEFVFLPPRLWLSYFCLEFILHVYLSIWKILFENCMIHFNNKVRGEELSGFLVIYFFGTMSQTVITTIFTTQETFCCSIGFYVNT